MTKTQEDPSGRESDPVTALRRLSLSDMPGFEILLLDEFAGWTFSVGNTGHGYLDKHAEMLAGTLLRAADRAGSFRPAQVPADSGEIVETRERVVAGAHELAESDNDLTLSIARVMPAVTGEPRRNSDEPMAQAYWLYHYSLLVLATGTSEAVDAAALRGISATFDAWNGLLADGFMLPWRRRQNIQLGKLNNRRSQTESSVSAEIVTSHVETLIERLTGVEKASPDADGDYPIRYNSALYYVRVTRTRIPIVQVFSVAVDGIRLTGALARDLNEINTQLHFCRTFWVRDQVLVEAEHLGPTLTGADFDECAINVAGATDAYARKLADIHGGRLAFDEAKERAYSSPAGDGTGFYL